MVISGNPIGAVPIGARDAGESYVWKYETSAPAFMPVFSLLLEGGSGGASITGAGAIASVEAFGSPTITRGTVSITTSGIASLEAFGSQTITRGTVTVTTSGVASLEAFGGATVARGTVSITGVGTIASLEAFGGTTVSGTGGLQSVTTSGIASLESFGSTIVSPGAVTVTIIGIGSLEAFGTQIVGRSVVASGIVTGEVFGTAITGLGAVAIIGAGNIATAESFGSGALATGTVSITGVGGIASSEAFGNGSIYIKVSLYPTSDITKGAWTPSSGTDLYPMINETTHNSDTWIEAGSLTECEVQLQPGADPGTDSDKVVKYWAYCLGTSKTLVVKLVQGTTVLETWTETNVPSTETFFSHTLIQPITDHTNLRLRFTVA
jgi:hypothetical protein